jgi:hypothetical protein
MVALEETRTNPTLKHAFSHEVQFDRWYPTHEDMADAAGDREPAAMRRVPAKHAMAKQEMRLRLVQERFA